MLKFFWDGPGYYAGYQYDSTYNGKPMVAYYRMDSADGNNASTEATQRHLGTPKWYDAPPDGAELA